MRSLGEPERGLAVWARYPVLARQVVDVLDGWVGARRAFARDLVDDLPALREAFGPELGDLRQVMFGSAETHRGGRTVALVRFAGATVVYKPRGLGIDLAFDRLLGWFNERGPRFALRRLRLLDRGDHGWCEFVQAAPTSVGDAPALLWRTGALLALMHAVGGFDLHADNVISDGADPVVIDLEALFHTGLTQPLVRRARLGDPAADRLATSVLRTGLLPGPLVMPDVFTERPFGVDISPFGPAERRTLIPIPKVDDPGTDRMRVGRGYRTVPAPPGRARNEDGTPLDPRPHRDALHDGHRFAYRLLAEAGPALVTSRDGRDGPLAGCGDVSIRLVQLSTFLYMRLLLESWRPEAMRLAEERERGFARLDAGWPGVPERARLIGVERDALWRGEVPVFELRPGHRHIWLEDGTVLRDVLPSTPLAEITERLDGLDEDDLLFQSRIIDAALDTIPTPTPAPALTPRLAPAQSPTSDQALTPDPRVTPAQTPAPRPAPRPAAVPAPVRGAEPRPASDSRRASDSRPASAPASGSGSGSGSALGATGAWTSRWDLAAGSASGLSAGLASRVDVDVAGRVAGSVVAELEGCAVRDGGGRIGWVTTESVDGTTRRVAAAGLDLYGGLPGIGLFLSYFSALTGNNERLAQNVGYEVARRCELAAELPAQDHRFQPHGLGAVYYLAHAAAVHQRPELAECARAVLLRQQGDASESDVLDGTAGTVFSALALHTVLPDDEILDLARTAGERLLHDAPSGPGFGYGAPGAAVALARLHRLVPDPRFLDQAKRLMLSVNPEEGVGWCRGAEGTATALVAFADARVPDGEKDDGRGLDDLLLDDGLEGLLARALLAVQGRMSGDDAPEFPDLLGEGPSPADELDDAGALAAWGGLQLAGSLCHGALSRLELPLPVEPGRDVAAEGRGQRTADSPSASSTAPGFAHALTPSSVPASAFAPCPPTPAPASTSASGAVPASVTLPGLFAGIAGVGFGVLRRARPDLVPSLLTLAPPSRPTPATPGGPASARTQPRRPAHDPPLPWRTPHVRGR
ncbi:DUF4135 domain-containing protein [Actinomadura oligospora]|uniref:DUF4135 domain-containing protein n=1 Tax=Actinomadura oligospora TaxID=111804 RepID=UPI001472A100|nr:DUF4135 domain-containing protein [Actinomadura oligospora]